jgi:hypothetical protein
MQLADIKMSKPSEAARQLAADLQKLNPVVILAKGVSSESDDDSGICP